MNAHQELTAAIWTLSVAIVISAAATNFLLFRAFGLELPPIAALFLLVVLQVGTAASLASGCSRRSLAALISYGHARSGSSCCISTRCDPSCHARESPGVELAVHRSWAARPLCRGPGRSQYASRR